VALQLSDQAILGANELAQFSALHVYYGGPMPPLHVTASRIKDSQPASLMKVSPQSVVTLSTPNVKPIRVPSRKRSPADEKFIQQEIASLLKKKLIKPSKSPWRAQLHVVHDEIRGKKLLVVDYSGTVKQYNEHDAYPLTLIEPFIDRISQYQIFSSLDLQSAFHQIPLDTNERHLTAFEGAGSLYEWLVLPFGLTNSGAVFARVLGDIVKDSPGCFHYLDDIVVAGASREEHDANLAKFLDLANSAGILFNSSKSSFGKETLTFLGHEISHGKIKPSPSRLHPILDYEEPKSTRQLERFLGLAVYHSKWVPDFAAIAAPLFNAKASKGPFPLPDVCKDSI
jgi:hypothetical protein